MYSPLQIGAALGLALLTLTVLPAAQAQINPTYFFGNIQKDEDVELFTFIVTVPGSVTIYTTSYSGGLNVNGTTDSPAAMTPFSACSTMPETSSARTTTPVQGGWILSPAAAATRNCRQRSCPALTRWR